MQQEQLSKIPQRIEKKLLADQASGLQLLFELSHESGNQVAGWSSKLLLEGRGDWCVIEIELESLASFRSGFDKACCRIDES